jgi:hypothetical protein
MYDPNQLYVDPILTNFSVGFRDQVLYADRLMPETVVGTKSGRYRISIGRIGLSTHLGVSRVR